MDADVKALIGSPNRDRFKFFHKQRGRYNHYAADLDLVLISFNPPGIIAALDYKTSKWDGITSTETVLYNHLNALGIPVYIILGRVVGENTDITMESIEIHEYVYNSVKKCGDTIKIKGNASVEELFDWENDLRIDYSLSHR
jgi:hypothetical protein